MTETEKAYIAGFIDGEGSIGFRKTHSERGYYDTTVRLRVTQCSREVLDWIKIVTDIGSVRQWARCSNKHQSRFEWYCSGKNAIALLKLLYPYLLVKKPQASLVFRFEDTMVGQGNLLSVEQKEKRMILREAMDSLMTHRRT